MKGIRDFLESVRGLDFMETTIDAAAERRHLAELQEEGPGLTGRLRPSYYGEQ